VKNKAKTTVMLCNQCIKICSRE